MALLSKREVLKMKLACLPSPHLRRLAGDLGVCHRGKVGDVIKRLFERQIDEGLVDSFIKERYAEKVEERRKLIADDELIRELLKVKHFSWGVVQGQLDRKIQTEYVRRFVKYDDLLRGVEERLHRDVVNYVVCTWFNHWTTVLIEEHIASHPRVEEGFFSCF